MLRLFIQEGIMADINWGVIGCGGIARKFVKSLAVLEQGTLLGGASRNRDRAVAFAEEFGLERVYDDYEALVRDPEVDVVYVATTHNFHFENVKLCLENGKHVLCEKPMTVSAAETKALIALAEEKKLFLMEGLWTRFLPAIRKINEFITDGAIGEVKTVSAQFNVGIGPDIDESHRIKNKALAGGCLLDLGVYPINFAAMVFGARPEKVSSDVTMGPTEVDYASHYFFDYGGGRRAVLSSSIEDMGPCEGLIMGSRGYIKTAPFFLSCRKFTMRKHGGEPKEYEFPCAEEETFKYEIEHVMERIDAGETESDVMPHAETLAIMELMDELRSQWGLTYDGE
jgi:predicted dehydrogenase